MLVRFVISSLACCWTGLTSNLLQKAELRLLSRSKRRLPSFNSSTIAQRLKRRRTGRIEPELIPSRKDLRSQRLSEEQQASPARRRPGGRRTIQKEPSQESRKRTKQHRTVRPESASSTAQQSHLSEDCGRKVATKTGRHTRTRQQEAAAAKRRKTEIEEGSEADHCEEEKASAANNNMVEEPILIKDEEEEEATANGYETFFTPDLVIFIYLLGIGIFVGNDVDPVHF